MSFWPGSTAAAGWGGGRGTCGAAAGRQPVYFLRAHAYTGRRARVCGVQRGAQPRTAALMLLGHGGGGRSVQAPLMLLALAASPAQGTWIMHIGRQGMAHSVLGRRACMHECVRAGRQAGSRGDVNVRIHRNGASPHGHSTSCMDSRGSFRRLRRRFGALEGQPPHMHAPTPGAVGGCSGAPSLPPSDHGLAPPAGRVLTRRSAADYRSGESGGAHGSRKHGVHQQQRDAAERALRRIHRQGVRERPGARVLRLEGDGRLRAGKGVAGFGAGKLGQGPTNWGRDGWRCGWRRRPATTSKIPGTHKPAPRSGRGSRPWHANAARRCMPWGNQVWWTAGRVQVTHTYTQGSSLTTSTCSWAGAAARRGRISMRRLRGTRATTPGFIPGPIRAFTACILGWSALAAGEGNGIEFLVVCRKRIILVRLAFPDVPNR